MAAAGEAHSGHLSKGVVSWGNGDGDRGHLRGPGQGRDMGCHAHKWEAPQGSERTLCAQRGQAAQGGWVEVFTEPLGQDTLTWNLTGQVRWAH